MKSIKTDNTLIQDKIKDEQFVRIFLYFDKICNELGSGLG